LFTGWIKSELILILSVVSFLQVFSAKGKPF
jgi:hypothetical protein